MNIIKFNVDCWLRKRRLKKSSLKLEKAILKNKKAKQKRIWIENNPHIHLLNYWYYKLLKGKKQDNENAKGE